MEDTYGEDPYLIAEMSIAFVNGYQRYPITCMPKHFVVHGSPTGGLNFNFVIGGKRIEKSMVILPLDVKNYKKVGVLGPYSDQTVYGDYNWHLESLKFWSVRHQIILFSDRISDSDSSSINRCIVPGFLRDSGIFYAGSMYS